MWAAGVDFCSRPAIQTFSKDGGHAGNYRTIKGKASTSFYSPPPAASFHQQRVDPTCNCGISCTMSERCATPSAGMTDVYDVIPLLVMRRISFAETIWEFFHAPSRLLPQPPALPPPPPPPLISVLGIYLPWRPTEATSHRVPTAP